jgi:protease I
MGSSDLKALVKQAYDGKKVVAAICIAPMILARAGVLRKRCATCYAESSVVSELKRGGARYFVKTVVIDGTMVTASGPSASAEFGRAVLGLLKGRMSEKLLSRSL